MFAMPRSSRAIEQGKFVVTRGVDILGDGEQVKLS
jgi:hypothetical protein